MNSWWIPAREQVCSYIETYPELNIIQISYLHFPLYIVLFFLQTTTYLLKCLKESLPLFNHDLYKLKSKRGDDRVKPISSIIRYHLITWMRSDDMLLGIS